MDRMYRLSTLHVILLSTIAVSYLQARGDNFLHMELCLGCICEATSNCNLTFHCTRGLCGPFLISHTYWDEAGQPVVAGDHLRNKRAYYRCVMEPYCAATTVRHYLTKYSQDCNGDGQIDCEDYARIHYMGGHQCTINMHNLGYYKVFRECQKSVQRLNG